MKKYGKRYRAALEKAEAGKRYDLKSAFATLLSLPAFIAEKIIDPETGLQTVVTIDASNGKDAYIYRYDKKSQKFYMDKVEKNKPSDKNKV